MSSFLSRRRSLQPFHFIDKEQGKVEATPPPAAAPATRPPPLIPSSAAVENVPQKPSRYRTTSTSIRIISRVSSIFTPKKKAPPPHLDLVNSSLNNNSRRPSCSSSIHTVESEDDIRRPSGLGSAVSITSRRSFGPSPPASPARYSTFPARDFPRTRAVSSPNLLRSLSWKVRKARHGSMAARSVSPIAQEPPPPVPVRLQSPKPAVHLPEEVIALILSHLPKSDVRSLATVSRVFASASRTTLYSSLEFDPLSPEQAEKLVAILVSRRELTDLVTTLTCRKWPPFFLPDVLNQNPAATATTTDHVIERKNALLTASFTLALERMSNLRFLTLPSFDFSLLSRHTAFGLQSLTFLTHSMTDAEMKALFAWLDGQTNIISLRFMNLEDTPSKTTLDNRKSVYIPHDDNIRLDFLAPSTPYLKPLLINGSTTPYSITPSSSPHSACFNPPSSPPSPITGFDSPTLLPNLTTLHATPALATLLTQTTSRRPLKSVTLNVNTTLYNGLRPASLMSSLHGISHLALKFSDNVDKRSIEKVLGAAGAALGACSRPLADESSQAQGEQYASEVEWLGLRSLEVSFRCHNSGREEALYKSLQASLARYKALSSLRFSISSANDHQITEENSDDKEEKTPPTPSASEQTLIDSWIKQCPTLESITLFSAAQFHQTAEHLQILLQEQKRKSKANLLDNGATFKFP